MNSLGASVFLGSAHFLKILLIKNVLKQPQIYIFQGIKQTPLLDSWAKDL